MKTAFLFDGETVFLSVSSEGSETLEGVGLEIGDEAIGTEHRAPVFRSGKEAIFNLGAAFNILTGYILIRGAHGTVAVPLNPHFPEAHCGNIAFLLDRLRTVCDKDPRPFYRFHLLRSLVGMAMPGSPAHDTLVAELAKERLELLI